MSSKRLSRVFIRNATSSACSIQRANIGDWKAPSCSVLINEHRQSVK